MTQDGFDATPDEQAGATTRSPDTVPPIVPMRGGDFGGRTTIADSVVARIAGLAAREVRGVYDMNGAGPSPGFGGLSGLFGAQEIAASRGVSVEVGQTECIIDLNIVIEYGARVPRVADELRRVVIERIRAMTGLDAREVNINVTDVYVPERVVSSQ